MIFNFNEMGKFEFGLAPVYKHRNKTIRLTIQYKAALTTCEHTQ